MLNINFNEAIWRRWQIFQFNVIIIGVFWLNFSYWKCQCLMKALSLYRISGSIRESRVGKSQLSSHHHLIDFINNSNSSLLFLSSPSLAHSYERALSTNVLLGYVVTTTSRLYGKAWAKSMKPFPHHRHGGPHSLVLRGALLYVWLA